MSDNLMDDFFAPAAQESNEPASAPVFKTCKVCESALGPLEIQARRAIHFDCQVCEYCKESIAHEILHRWLLDKGPRAHSTCYETYMQEEIKKRPVTITQGMLDYLNNWRLCPDMSRTVESNQDAASLQARKCVVDMNYDEIYVLLKMAQAFCGTISEIVSQNQQSDALKLRIQKADAERSKRSSDLVKDAQETRISQQAQIEEKRTKKLLAKSTPEGKLLNMFMKMGMTLEQAKHQLASSKKIGEGSASAEQVN